jgi:hypothetical protein
MYEHPIKRAGLSMNRIIFSNTKMVAQGFPALKEQQFRLSFKYRTFENGKATSTKCKLMAAFKFDKKQNYPHLAF